MPDAVTLPLSHFVELPVIFDGRFKLVLRAFCLPLHGVDLILGMPWQSRHDAMLHACQRRACSSRIYQVEKRNTMRVHMFLSFKIGIVNPN
jgi:hypothetical protein